MIAYLTKLATLLDERGQHQMAKEVDGLIEKLAQMSSVDQNQSLPENAPAKPAAETPKATKSFDDLTTQVNAFMSGLKTWAGKSKELQALYMNLNSALKTHLSYDTADYLRKESPAVITAFQKLGPSAEGVAQQWLAIMDVVDGLPRLPGKPAPAAQPTAPAGVATKAPAHKAKHNPLVEQLQKNLGLKPTGVWDKLTNKKFIEVMNSYPEYAKMMEGGKFNGTLQQAVQMTGNLQTLNEMPQGEGTASRAPAKQEDDFETPGQKMWKSKHFQMTPEAMTALRTLDQKRGPGAGQRLVDIFDRTPGQTQQAFEEVLKDRAAKS